MTGSGIDSKSGHSDAATRAMIGVAFKRWTQVADADGLTDYFGLQSAVADALSTDGEAFLHLIQTAAGPKLRILPSEMVDESKTTSRACVSAQAANVSATGFSKSVRKTL
jgi:hypothetical protein